jgi:hypothetical protein
MAQAHSPGESLVLAGTQQGFTVIPSPTRLTRLHYFDGKFLRAADLEVEQRYLRSLVELSNQAGEAGVVHGFDTTLADSGDKVQIGPGLAIDPAGRTLLLPNPTEASFDALIEASQRSTLAGGTPAGPASLATSLPRPFGFAVAPGARPATVLRRAETERLPIGAHDVFGECTVAAGTPPSDVSSGSDLYLLTIGHAEAHCGHEDVYGRLCEQACVTSADRPYVVEGVVIRLTPLILGTPLATSRVVALNQRHRRSLVASAFYADERKRVGSLISKAGLALDTWCLGADLAGGSNVPLAVVARSGSVTVFLDAWTARRERMEAPSRRYWAWRMAMRPWSVYLAQILQFQCQLHELFQNVPQTGGPDPCRDHAVALGDAVSLVEKLEKAYAAGPAAFTAGAGAGTIDPMAVHIAALGGVDKLAMMKARFMSIIKDPGQPRDRILIRGGIVELPAAGYLPVTPAAAENVNAQVRALLGEGVDLRFCVVRPDFVAHALEEAQHMERISLLEGLDDPDRKPEVDILVPDGQILRAPVISGVGFEANVALHGREKAEQPPAPPPPGTTEAPFSGGLIGAARGERMASGGGTFHLGASGPLDPRSLSSISPLLGIVAAGQNTQTAALLAALRARSLATVSATRSYPSFLWLTMRSERDPFALAANQTSQVDLEMDFLVTIGKGKTGFDTQFVLLRILLSGPFTVTASQKLVAGPKVVGSFTGRASFTVMGVVTGSRVNDSTHIEAKSVKLTGDRHTGGLTAELSQSVAGVTVDYSVKVEWDDAANGEGPQASLSLALTDEQGAEVPGVFPDPLVSLALEESAEVFKVENPNHAFAVSAIDQVDTAIATAEPPFSPEEAKRRLFTTPAVSPGDIAVRATRDWVLFHRRRTKDCATPVEKPPQPPVKTTCQSIYRLDPARRAELLKLIEANRLSELLALPGAALFLGELDFKVDTADIADGDTEVAAAWRAGSTTSPEGIFVFSQKGNAEAGSATLRATRAKALADLLPDGSQAPGLGLKIQEVENAIAGRCPVVVLVMPKAAVTCLEVVEFPLRANAEGQPDLTRWIELQRILSVVDQDPATWLARLAALLKVAEALSRGPVNFVGLTSTIPDGSGTAVANALTSGTQVMRMATWIQGSDASLVSERAGGLVTVLTTAGRIQPAGAGFPVDPFATATKPDIDGTPGALNTCAGFAFVGTFAKAQRTALVMNVFFTGQTNLNVHTPEANPASRGQVKFTADVPDAGLATVLGTIPTLFTIPAQYFVNGIYLGAISPIDAGAMNRVNAVAAALGTHLQPHPGTGSAPRKIATTLTQADRKRIEDAGISLAGIDEVIYLETVVLLT